MTGFTDRDVPDQVGKTFVVTGANTGIGFEIARVLARKRARVLLGCRDKAKADGAIDRLRAETPGAEVAHLPLDLADLASVREAADLAAQERRIDGLINNAGVMFPPLGHTANGFELQFGINHLGPFALTGLMLPKLAETPGSRIVVTSSLAHRNGEIDWHDLDAQRSYKRAARYSASKLANMLHFFELDRRLRKAGSPVAAIGCHPGVAATELMRHAGPFRVVTPLFGALLNTAAQGAWPALQAACGPTSVSGQYYGPTGWGGARGPSGPASRTKAAQDPTLAKVLWEISVGKTGVDPGLPAVGA